MQTNEQVISPVWMLPGAGRRCPSPSLRCRDRKVAPDVLDNDQAGEGASESLLPRVENPEGKGTKGTIPVGSGNG